MKLRNPALIRAAGLGLAGVLNAWLGTLRYRSRALVPGIVPTDPTISERFIYAFWHETLLIPAMAYRGQNVRVLISQHADGELIAQVCRHLGLGVVRGSTTRGGAGALKEMMDLASCSHLAITPDGPRGPRRVAQHGAVYLAAETGLAIVPCGFAFHHAWRAPSWDRFAVPMPFTPAVGVAAPPIRVPSGLGRGELEQHRIRLEQAMHEVTRIAEEMAAREQW